MAMLTDFVRPGDVITSGLLNRIITLLNQHDALLSAGPSPVGNGPTITGFVPDPPFQAGQDIQILGANFGFSTGSTVLKFDSTQVNAFRLGSSDTSLLVTVPFLAGLGSGKDVVLSLSNGTLGTARVVRVNPMQQPQQGNVDVLWNDAIVPNPNPNPIANGQPVTLAYVLKSRALLPATFTIGVQCSNAAMQAAAVVLDAAQATLASKQIDLAPNEQKGFFIRFPTVPVANNNSFTLTVSATATGVAGSDTRVFTVNSAVTPPDPTISLAFNALSSVDPNTGNPDPTASYSAGDNTVHLKQGMIGRVNLVATFTQIGTYSVSVATLPPTANWTVALAATPSQYTINAGDFSGGVATKNPEIGIQAQAGASTAGQLKLTLQRQGSTQTREITFNLSRLP
jgi:IPT/TIG domain-containing protein